MSVEIIGQCGEQFAYVAQINQWPLSAAMAIECINGIWQQILQVGMYSVACGQSYEVIEVGTKIFLPFFSG